MSPAVEAGPATTRALVTGAGGFIGSHLATDLAQREVPVTALDLDLGRVRQLADYDDVELIEGDLTDPEVQLRALESVDVVYHLAAAHLGARVPRAEFWRVNVEALGGLLRRSAESGIRRFVHCSSVGVYGRLTDPPADEETPCRPELPYEESKLAGEQVVRKAVDEGLVEAVILRPAWVYGPGCQRTEKLFRTIGKGRFVVAGSGRSYRHCVYVRDMVEALRLAAEVRQAVGRVIIIGDDQPVPVRRLVDEIARLTGASRPRSVPLPVLGAAALAAEIVFRAVGREPPLSRRTLKFFTANTAFDVARARQLLGFRPRYDLESGLAETWRLLAGAESVEQA